MWCVFVAGRALSCPSISFRPFYGKGVHAHSNAREVVHNFVDKKTRRSSERTKMVGENAVVPSVPLATGV